MNSEVRGQPGFFKTVWLLLGAARRRSGGRRRRQQELLNARSGRKATDWSGIGFAFAVLFMVVLNILAGVSVHIAVGSGERLEAERRGKIVVSKRFLEALYGPRADQEQTTPSTVDQVFPSVYTSEANRLAERFGGSEKEIEARLRSEVQDHGGENLIAEDDAAPGIRAIASAGRIPAMLGSIALLWWAMMLVCQGEGLELDLQRRRHPMWEWLFTHPAPPGAIFLAEMLSPLAANPIYWGAPLFAGVVYGSVYGFGLGALAAVLIGIPITIAAACVGKALEIGVILRFSPRTRGAMIGLIGWFGYASMMLLFIGMFAMPRVITAIGSLLAVLTVLPWPWLGLFLGIRSDGSFSFSLGMLACWIAAVVAIGGGVWFSVWGAQQGLAGNFGSTVTRPSASRTGAARFGKEPLYRKEFLWFLRDRSAIVQTILIPLTAAGFQVFNLHRAFHYAQGAWNYLCGAAILFGTYFLWILGPKSLASEGSALWIALTWPRGLESLLKAKAWLWSMISSGLVAMVLGYACYLFPTEIWKIALVGVAWYFFARSMAEKSVTLVTVASSSGETEKIPAGRRWATQLGMLTFSIGVMTQQWHIAVMGIVYSFITAAAMWQNFRARLPYLYDPWSEKVPPPPTLMHAMIAISILVEGGAVVTGVLTIFMGRDNIAIAQAISYGVCAVIVSFAVAHFLGNRGVRTEDVWCWQATKDPDRDWEPWWRALGFRDASLFSWLLAAGIGGVLLGMFARGYLAVLAHLPATAEMIRRSQEQMAKIPNLHVSYAVMAVLFAPFAEEYLFRGLMFRALDREWGGWRAVLGSAAFFAIYHPPLSWLPVALLGTANALLFKKTGRLAPAVVLHMVYNAVVLF